MIGVVIQLDDATGGVEVCQLALIRAVEGSWTLLDNQFLLQWHRLRG